MGILAAPIAAFVLCWAFWRCTALPEPFWPWFRRAGLYPWLALTVYGLYRLW